MRRHRLRKRYGRARNPRPQSHGFLVIDTKTGEILSELFKRRDGAREFVRERVKAHGHDSPQPGEVQYIGGRWYRPLGVHQVRLYPGETYSRETYKP